MHEEKSKPVEEKQEKKISRKTLTFYIISLCTVAIALIMISYVVQVRTDKQLDNLSTKLSEQQTVAQGAAERVEVLQKQITEQSDELEKIRILLGIKGTNTEITKEIENIQKQRDAAYDLLLIEKALKNNETEIAKETLHSMQQKYKKEELEDAENGILGPEGVTLYNEMVKELAE